MLSFADSLRSAPSLRFSQAQDRRPQRFVQSHSIASSSITSSSLGFGFLQSIFWWVLCLLLFELRSTALNHFKGIKMQSLKHLTEGTRHKPGHRQPVKRKHTSGMATGTKLAFKPWKAEYAKSARSSCRTCGHHIEKDSFRLARMQPAQQFGGMMPQWHHASCVFHRDDEIKSLEEVDGLEDLRAADLQHLRKYIEGSLRASDREVDKGKSVAPIPAAGGSGDNSGEYEIENAKSSRSICKSCNGKIEKGHVRVATMVDNPRFRGKQPAWRHVKCFLELGWWTSPMPAMAGWDNLSVKDQAEVQELAKHSPGMKEGTFVDRILERHEVNSKRKKDSSNSLSPKKSPRLSRIKEKITDAIGDVMTKKDTNDVKRDRHALQRDNHAVKKDRNALKRDTLAVKKDRSAVKKKPTRRSVY